MAESVTLTLSERDQERLEKLASVRKDKAVWEHERTYERSRREYLGEDVLKDTGSAVVWWLARNEDRVDKTVEDIGLLAQLSSAANNQMVAPPFEHLVPHPRREEAPTADYGDCAAGPWPTQEASVAEILEAFLQASGIPEDDPERVLFARRVAGIADAHGRPEVADELVEYFDPPAEAEAEAEAEGEAEEEAGEAGDQE